VPADSRGDPVQPRGIALHQKRVGALPPSEAGGNQLLIGQGRHPEQDTGLPPLPRGAPHKRASEGRGPRVSPPAAPQLVQSVRD
jgi:hypothetical protein